MMQGTWVLCKDFNNCQVWQYLSVMGSSGPRLSMAYIVWLVGHLLHCLADNEPEDPEKIPEHIQRMKCSRVIRTNFSLLYSHLDTGRLLSKLPDKELISETQLKSAKSYHQRFAQNAILTDTLLNMDRPSNGLLKFCDTMETTQGQEDIGKKLLQGIQIIMVSRGFSWWNNPHPTPLLKLKCIHVILTHLFQSP